MQRDKLFEFGQVSGRVDVHFPAGKLNGYQRAWRLHQQWARASVATKRLQLWKDATGKHGWNAQNACIG